MVDSLSKGSSMRRRSMSMFGVAAGLVLAAAVAGGCSSSAGTPVAFTDTPEHLSYSTELQVYEDLGSMTASSDLVVKATVTGTSQGRTFGTAEDGGATTTREVHLRIDKVIYQKTQGQAPKSIVLAEGTWNDKGLGVMSEGLPWSKVGDTGYYYLSADDSYPTGDHYSLLWSQGRLLISGTGVSISGDHDVEGPWMGVDVSASGLSALEASITGAAHEAKTGKAKAVKPEMCARAPEMAACKG